MIVSLEGKIVFRTDRFLIIEVGGVGYKVFANAETLRKVHQKEDLVKIFTNLYLREDAIELYGFWTLAELDFFETLNRVSGVGPRTALGILGMGPIDMLKKAIAAGQTSYLTKVSGIGRKTAEKIIIELREKMGEGKGVESSEEFRAEEDALEALRSLGYSLNQVRQALSEVPPEIKGAQDRIKAALKILGRQNG
ncbi:MAG: Holliday junction branch migration protein RuvA [Patescibacteria group bacterium]